MPLPPCTDVDGDGFSTQSYCGSVGFLDCNDNDGTIFPSGSEVCGDVVDNNCNGQTDCYDHVNCDNIYPCFTSCTDADLDGYAIEGGNCGLVDCNDANAAINPGMVEIVGDGKDQDCNGYDLTIKITKATWSKSTTLLTVTATSALGIAANLLFEDYYSTEPMTWVPPIKKSSGSWIRTKTIPTNPGGVLVSGPERNVNATVKSVR